MKRGVDITHFFYREGHLFTICKVLMKVLSPNRYPGLLRCRDHGGNQNKLMALYAQLPYLRDMIDNINQQHLIHKVMCETVTLAKPPMISIGCL